MKDSNKVIVAIDSELEDLALMFLENRKGDLVNLKKYVGASNFTEIERIGHNVQGVAGSLGFDYLVTIGRDLEKGSKSKDKDLILSKITSFEEYLGKVTLKVD